MVPLYKMPGGTVRGFPRASGDGPCSISVPRLAGEFPPRERGWSLSQGPTAEVIGVSPARAGMVPGVEARLSSRRSFPRASGDGPLLRVGTVQEVEFPPRVRGWSQGKAGNDWLPPVSPARAGMVP